MIFQEVLATHREHGHLPETSHSLHTVGASPHTVWNPTAALTHSTPTTAHITRQEFTMICQVMYFTELLLKIRIFLSDDGGYRQTSSNPITNDDTDIHILCYVPIIIRLCLSTSPTFCFHFSAHHCPSFLSCTHTVMRPGILAFSISSSKSCWGSLFR